MSNIVEQENVKENEIEEQKKKKEKKMVTTSFSVTFAGNSRRIFISDS